MTQARACWSVLLAKAQDEASRVQAEMQQQRQRIQALQASRERLLRMHADYQRPPAPGATSVGMQDALNRRQFAAQLLTVLQRVDQDLAQAERVLAGMRQRLLVAEKERLKMQALFDQDQRNARKDAQAREQRQFDDLGVLKFNLGAQASSPL